uniref:Uncharacterized protein n=1 Tax=Setaria viridis TaxID=4556 RepID=A0A4U6W4J5_SETVI|nr:hypothetical protein SEVIR_2G453833v2 [Setaria viridis]
MTYLVALAMHDEGEYGPAAPRAETMPSSNGTANAVAVLSCPVLSCPQHIAMRWIHKPTTRTAKLLLIVSWSTWGSATRGRS